MHNLPQAPPPHPNNHFNLQIIKMVKAKMSTRVFTNQREMSRSISDTQSAVWIDRPIHCVNSESFSKWLFSLVQPSCSPAYKKWISPPLQDGCLLNLFSLQIHSLCEFNLRATALLLIYHIYCVFVFICDHFICSLQTDPPHPPLFDGKFFDKDRSGHLWDYRSSNILPGFHLLWGNLIAAE